MIRTIARACVALLLIVGIGSAQAAARVLFVGNSLTYYNAMPAMVAALGTSSRPGIDIKFDLLAQAGASIRDHLNTGELARQLEQRRYDVVVFQEVGGFPLCNDGFPGCTDSPDALQAIIALIRRHHATPVWLATYAAATDQDELSRLVRDRASQYHVVVADAGALMQRYSREDPAAALLRPNLHPTALGSWVIAASVFHALYPARALPDGSEVVCAPDWTAQGPAASALASTQSPRERHCSDAA